MEWNEDNKISVIVPVFNVEKYLKKCVDSILRQEKVEFEIILVDDGSTDNSGVICDEFAEKYSNVTALHKENGGLSEARNYGVQASHYQLISFVDSDDFIEKSYLNTLLQCMKKDQSDISVCGAKCVDENGELINFLGSCQHLRLNKIEALEKMCYGYDLPIYAWGKLYKKDIILRHPFPVGKLHEDVATTYLLLSECNTVSVTGTKDYFYLKRQGSILHQKYTREMYFAIESSIQMIEFFKINYPDLVVAGYGRLAIEANAFLHRCINDKDFKLIQEKVFHNFIHNWKLIIFNKSIPIGIRLQLVFCKINWRLYQKVYKIIKE